MSAIESCNASLAICSNATLSSTPMPMTDIARVVAASVAKMVLGGGVAAVTFRHMRSTGKLQKSVLKDMSCVNKEVLLPLFIFVNVSRGVNYEMILSLYFVPVFIAASLWFGYLAGRASAMLTRTPAPQRPAAVTVVTFSNVVGLPLPLLMSLIDGLDQWKDKDDFHARGTSCTCAF